MGDELKIPDAFLELFAGIETQAKEKAAEEAAKVQKSTDASAFLAKLDEQIKKSVSESVESKVSAEVAKVFDTMRAQSGTGKTATIQKGATLEDNPAEFIIAKSSADKSHDNLTLEEKDYIAELTKKMLTTGLIMGNE